MANMKDTKIKCSCGCGQTLYLADFGDGELAVEVEKNAKKGFKTFRGVIVDKQRLLKLLGKDS